MAKNCRILSIYSIFIFNIISSHAHAVLSQTQEGDEHVLAKHLSPVPPLQPTSLGGFTSYIALCAAVKDDPMNVKEWVDYHAALGISKMYLMVTDDPNSEAMHHALASHVANGLVELYFLPRVNPRTINLLQVRLYDICLQSVRWNHQFIGFWDVDEFLVPLDQTITNITSFLRNFEDVGGLGVGWRVVGPSGHIHPKPSHQSLREAYRKCTSWDFPDNEEIKTIVNTKYALYPRSDPHTFEYGDGKYAVDAERTRIDGSRNVEIRRRWRDQGRPPRLALYHYVTKSEDEYREKMRRGSAMGNRKDWEYFKRIEAASTVNCD